MKPKIFMSVFAVSRLVCSLIMVFLLSVPVFAAEKLTVNNRLQESSIINKYQGSVSRTGDRLYLKLKNGSSIVLSDQRHPDSFGHIKYVFIDYIDKGFFVIEAFYFGGVKTLMMSDKTSEIWQIYARPRLSPDKRRFVTVAPTTAANEISGVFIWGFTNKGVVKEWSYKVNFIDDFPYRFAGWRDDDNINLIKTIVPGNGICTGANSMEIPVVLMRVGNGWKFGREDFERTRCK